MIKAHRTLGIIFLLAGLSVIIINIKGSLFSNGSGIIEPAGLVRGDALILTVGSALLLSLSMYLLISAARRSRMK